MQNRDKPDHTIDRLDLLSRAAHPNSTTPRPFLRWAGSKRALLEHLTQALPEKFRIYREPFLGAGSLFFLLRPRRAVLSDTCTELIETFRAVRDDVEAVKSYLEPLKSTKEVYYSIRDKRSDERIRRASEFIYLNKACWNGLYRVNSAGKFNVPFGWPRGENVTDPDNLIACSMALRRRDVKLRVCDFEENLSASKPGDLVYLDPPYVTGHNNNGFIDYNETLFSWADQIRLANLAKRLARRGVSVIISNANHEGILRLYPGFNAYTFQRFSTLAGNAAKRGSVSEVVLWSI